MKIYKLFSFVSLVVLIPLAISCGGNEARMKQLEAQNDSLQNAVQNATDRYTELSGFLSDVSECVDSVATQENLIFLKTNPETGRPYTRNEIRERVIELGNLIDRQRARIAALTDSIGKKGDANTNEVKRLTQLVAYLNEQLAAKEAQMQTLQAELATSKRSIAQLQDSVSTAQAANEQLRGENETLDRLVEDQTNQLNQAYFLAKPKKELENMGILKKGGLLKKSKFNPGDVDISMCLPIDTRTFTEATLNSKKKPVLLTQAPASSYVFEEIGKGQWRFTITDTMGFWSLSKIVIIQLQ